MNHKMYFLMTLLLSASLMLAGCGSSAPPADIQATVDAQVAATLAAQATTVPPSPTPLPPTDTPTPPSPTPRFALEPKLIGLWEGSVDSYRWGIEFTNQQQAIVGMMVIPYRVVSENTILLTDEYDSQEEIALRVNRVTAHGMELEIDGDIISLVRVEAIPDLATRLLGTWVIREGSEVAMLSFDGERCIFNFDSSIECDCQVITENTLALHITEDGEIVTAALSILEMTDKEIKIALDEPLSWRRAPENPALAQQIVGLWQTETGVVTSEYRLDSLQKIFPTGPGRVEFTASGDYIYGSKVARYRVFNNNVVVIDFNDGVEAFLVQITSEALTLEGSGSITFTR